MNHEERFEFNAHSHQCQHLLVSFSKLARNVTTDLKPNSAMPLSNQRRQTLYPYAYFRLLYEMSRLSEIINTIAQYCWFVSLIHTMILPDYIISTRWKVFIPAWIKRPCLP